MQTRGMASVMESDTSQRTDERRFVVFPHGDISMGIPAELVLRILASGGSEGTEPKESPDARWLVLQTTDGTVLSPVEVAGNLRIVTVKSSQIAPMPPQCGKPPTAPLAAAITEDKVLFLIVDPTQLPQRRAAHSNHKDGSR